MMGRRVSETHTDEGPEEPEGLLAPRVGAVDREEARHKLFFESEYDERVLIDN